MDRKIAHIALVVRDYDEAIVLDQNKRWVLVSPSSESGSSLLLAEASK